MKVVNRKRVMVAAFAALMANGIWAEPASSVTLPERLTISFWIWGLYDTEPGGAYHDYDARMKELVDRGFNCVRIDDAAGLLTTAEGKPREQIAVRQPFGKFTGDLRQNVVTTPRTCRPRERLLELFRAADRQGVKVILSTWYYLHTNWFLDESVNGPLCEGMSVERKFAYFADDLDRILSLLRENGLDHRIAYAELFNEFDGLPFTARYGHIDDPAKAAHLRDLHERAIARLKAAHPGVKFAYDVARFPIQRELVPRNADVLAVHPYYLWGIYMDVFEKDSVRGTTKELPIAPEAARYLVDKPYSIADVVATRGGNLRTGNDWNARVRLYASLDDAKIPALEQALETALRRDRAKYEKILADVVADAVAVRNEILPTATLVMSEGVAYCASNRLQFEEHSDLYWEILRGQSKLLRANGFWGAIPRTTCGPEDPSWGLRAKDYRAINDLFTKGEAK